MRFVKAANIKTGMKVAKAIQRKNQEIPLIQEHVILTEEMISQIQKYQIYGIYIEDYTQSFLPWDQILHDARVSMHKNQNKKMTIAESADMVEQILMPLSVQTPVAMLLQRIYHLDKSVYEHSRRVAQLSGIIGLQITQDLREIGNLILAGLLHDIGVIKITPEILFSQGPLTTMEEEQMKLHVIYGYQFLKKSTFLSESTVLAILQHHENYDGSGYPGQVKSRAITLYGRILRVADEYDNMIFPIRKRKSNGTVETQQYMLAQSGKLFDPILVKLFLTICAYMEEEQVEQLSFEDEKHREIC